jgi:hypothetical protein
VIEATLVSDLRIRLLVAAFLVEALPLLGGVRVCCRWRADGIGVTPSGTESYC